MQFSITGNVEPPLREVAEGRWVTVFMLYSLIIMQHANNHYNKNLKSLASILRNDMPPGEKKLWYQVLSNKKMMNCRFLRQRAIENYIVDFVCLELRLIIEVDGKSHDYKVNYDTIRDNTLAELGYTTLRLRHADVMHDIDSVKRIIETKITELSS
jgi:very-short-patch-repair endonuclease